MFSVESLVKVFFCVAKFFSVLRKLFFKTASKLVWTRIFFPRIDKAQKTSKIR